MAILFFSGFETGDKSEWVANAAFTTVTTPVRTGNYAVSVAAGNNVLTSATFASSGTLYLRSYIRLHGLSANIAFGQLDILGLGPSAGGMVGVITDASGNPSLVLGNQNSFVQIGAAQPVALDTWILVEMKVIFSTTVGQEELRINGATVITSASNLNTGADQTTGFLSWSNDAATGTPAGTIFFDDVAISNTGYPGAGGCIARQITANGNYNAWTYSTGTLLSGVLNDTPTDSTTNVNTVTAANKFSGTVTFSDASSTGSTGHGSQIVGSSDAINSFKIGMYGRTAAADTADQTIFRTPAGAGGADTTTTLPAWTTAAAPGSYQQTILAATPTAAQVLNCEVGVNKAGTSTHTIYSLWAMVDYTPAAAPAGVPSSVAPPPYAAIQGNQPWRAPIRDLHPRYEQFSGPSSTPNPAALPSSFLMLLPPPGPPPAPSTTVVLPRAAIARPWWAPVPAFPTTTVAAAPVVADRPPSQIPIQAVRRSWWAPAAALPSTTTAPPPPAIPVTDQRPSQLPLVAISRPWLAPISRLPATSAPFSGPSAAPVQVPDPRTALLLLTPGVPPVPPLPDTPVVAAPPAVRTGMLPWQAPVRSLQQSSVIFSPPNPPSYPTAVPPMQAVRAGMAAWSAPVAAARMSEFHTSGPPPPVPVDAVVVWRHRANWQ